MKEVTPATLQSYYYSTFAGEQGAIVLNDIKMLLTGVDIDSYEGVDPLLPPNELAARTATRNAWDMIQGFTEEVEIKRPSFWWLVKETYRIYKYNRKKK
jgi:hypothetical protein